MYNKEEYTMTNCHEVFEKINTRQVEALMFHNEMADYFGFLAYNGYKRIHEYQYISESLEHRKTKRYFMKKHNMILKDSHINDPKIIPSEWFARERKEANDSVKLKAVKEGMHTYHEWEAETLKIYEGCAKMLLDWGMVSDYNFVVCLIQDVSKELEEIEKIILDLISTDYDMVFILESQCWIHKQYKKKMSKLL